jgi:hypothetical protein
VAIKMRQATSGLQWYQKMVAALGVIVVHWPFILMLVGFSWLVNFEHAKEFHSTMLSAAEQVSLNLIVWQGTLGDLNPVIASSFPLLAVAYTGMADHIGEESQIDTQSKTAQMPSATAHVIADGAQMREESTVPGGTLVSSVPSADSFVPGLHADLLGIQASQQQMQQALLTMAEQQQVSMQQMQQALLVMAEQQQQAMLQLTQHVPQHIAEEMAIIFRAIREQEMANQKGGTAEAAENSTSTNADVLATANQQQRLKLRDPATVLSEIIEQFPSLAGNEMDVLQVLEMYQKGMDRTRIRETLRFGTHKYTRIVKPIGDLIQTGQIALFEEDKDRPSINHLPKEQTEQRVTDERPPSPATDVPILLTEQTEAMPGMSGSNQYADTMPDAMPVLLSTPRMSNADEVLASYQESISISA